MSESSVIRSLLATLMESRIKYAASDVKRATMKLQQKETAENRATLEASKTRYADIRSQIDNLKSKGLLNQFSDYEEIEEEQLSDFTNQVKSVDLIQIQPSTAIVQPDPAESLIKEAKEVTITMMPAKADAAADTTTELTSVGHKATTSSHVVQPVRISNSELTRVDN